MCIGYGYALYACRCKYNFVSKLWEETHQHHAKIVDPVNVAYVHCGPAASKGQTHCLTGLVVDPVRSKGTLRRNVVCPVCLDSPYDGHIAQTERLSPLPQVVDSSLAGVTQTTVTLSSTTYAWSDTEGSDTDGSCLDTDDDFSDTDTKCGKTPMASRASDCCCDGHCQNPSEFYRSEAFRNPVLPDELYKKRFVQEVNMLLCLSRRQRRERKAANLHPMF
ncbi:hypothetical protein SPI_06360 [Niveomyces insectorum RCEF 264]|uniref:Uncharacterized protein n=1 Tax=Niveomyces insectorum RCEF 264 TaxID=1081102 RepID=A0A167S222_9HYPO|nr:hypothetical protein SPI_06360 [Niveomyces insectorum RCEF 264]